MPVVKWSDRAEAQLAGIDPAVASRLRSTAPKVLHHIGPDTRFCDDEGFEGEVMWHRAIAHEVQVQETEQDGVSDGPWNYFYFYTPWSHDSHLEDPHLEFEIQEIRYNADHAGRVLKAAMTDLLEQTNGQTSG
jgi:hypothetical protein